MRGDPQESPETDTLSTSFIGYPILSHSMGIHTDLLDVSEILMAGGWLVGVDEDGQLCVHPCYSGVTSQVWLCTGVCCGVQECCAVC